jgi:hypothetical protein
MIAARSYAATDHFHFGRSVRAGYPQAASRLVSFETHLSERTHTKIVPRHNHKVSCVTLMTRRDHELLYDDIFLTG